MQTFEPVFIVLVFVWVFQILDIFYLPVSSKLHHYCNKLKLALLGMGYCYDILFLLVFLFTPIIFYLYLGSIGLGTLVYFVFSIE